MDPTMMTYVALALPLIFIIIKLLISSTTKKKKNLPPSPPSLPLIGHLYLFKKPLHRTLGRLADRYGPAILLRFGSRPVLIVSSQPLAEECFTKNDVAFATRPQLPTVKDLTYNYTAFGSAPYGPHWRNMRRIATVEILSSHRLNSFSGVRSDEVKSMVRLLYRESPAAGGGPTRVELRPRLFGLSLNVMMMMVSGRRYYGEHAGDEEEARQFRAIVEETFSVGGVSNLRDFLPLLRLFDVQGMKKKLARLYTTRDRILQGIIDEHRKVSEEERKDTMIGVMLSMQKSDPNYYTDENIKALIITMLSAGTDTSSHTIEWALSLLLNNPESLKKAQAEIDAHVPHDRLLDESDLAHLPYLHCIISETLRVFPVAPLLLPHESMEDCVVGGYDVPRGTMLLVNAHAIHTDPTSWVEPAKFVPERFEVKDGGEAKWTIPFGMGRRRCPGEGLAMRVVGLELGTLLQCFEWERVGKEEVDLTEGTGLTLPKAIPLEAMYRPRQTMVDFLSRL